jgi:hypothetical protein
MKLPVVFLALSTAGCLSMAAKGAPHEPCYSETRAQANQFGGLEVVDDGGVGLQATLARVAPDVDVPKPADRRIVFNASVLLQIADPDSAEKEARRIVEDVKGWAHRIEGSTLTFRVPAAHFMTALDGIAKIGKILDRKVAGTDVTEEYRDLELRIDNAEKLRVRIAALLEKAKDVKEALEVERELARVTEEIERLKGRLNSLGDGSAYSTIVVMLQRNAPARLATTPTVRFPFRWIRELGVERLTAVRP